MQLVLSNNRIIAHGENFLAMGGVVINTETGAKYENATVAECDGCPSDIDNVGYEYHGGVFVPCAPYGVGNQNGYVMEVCKDCATPRSSGIPIKDIKWSKIASVVCAVESTSDTIEKNLTFPISTSDMAEYSMLRYRIKAGSYMHIGRIPYESSQNEGYSFPIITVGGETVFQWTAPRTGSTTWYDFDREINFTDDLFLPFNVIVGNGCYSMSTTERYGEAEVEQSCGFYMPTGGEVDPTSIGFNMPTGWHSSAMKYYNSANVVIELEGRR